MEINKYQVVDADGDTVTGLEFFDYYQEAKDAAERAARASGEPMKIMEYTFEYSDSALVWSTDTRVTHRQGMVR